MIGTAILCATALCIAIAMFARELRLWRARAELDGPIFRYSRRRFIRRTLGCALLAATMVMTFLGLEVIDFTGRLLLFQIFWATVGAFCIALLVLPLLDMRETYKHLLRDGADARMQAELVRIEKELRAKAACDAKTRGGDKGTAPPEKSP